MMKFWKLNVVGCTLLLLGLFAPLFAQIETGVASFYSDRYHLNPDTRTASGELYDRNQLTAAHKTLAFNTYVRVTNLDNGREVVVRINDRGPYTDGRIIDLSGAAAEQIDLVRMGTAPVRIEPVEAPLERGQAPDRRVTVDFPANTSSQQPVRTDLADLPLVDAMGRSVSSTPPTTATSRESNLVPVERGYNANARVANPSSSRQVQVPATTNPTRRTTGTIVTDPETFVYRRQEADLTSSVPLPPTANEVVNTNVPPVTNATERVAAPQPQSSTSNMRVAQASVGSNRRIIQPPTAANQSRAEAPLVFSMIAQPQATIASGYGVQVGAYFDWKRLHTALAKINAQGIPNTMVQIGQKDGKEIFRILIGPYGSKADAERMRRQMGSKGVEGISVFLPSLK